MNIIELNAVRQCNESISAFSNKDELCNLNLTFDPKFYSILNNFLMITCPLPNQVKQNYVGWSLRARAMSHDIEKQFYVCT